VDAVTIGLAAALGVFLGAGAALLFRLRQDRKSLDSAKVRSEEILTGARREAESIRKAAEIAARDEALRNREKAEAELEEKRSEVRQMERKLDRKEEVLDRKSEQLDRREQELSEKTTRLGRDAAKVKEREEAAEALVGQHEEKLRQIAGLAPEEARKIMLDRAKEEVEGEVLTFINRRVDLAREESDSRAREIVLTSIQRVAADHSSETTVSVVPLPSDDMKGRIIGREGRNIRSFEKTTGVDVIVDDTPGVVVVSAFDAVRRETARRTMAKLVLDGRIHPARIEEIYAETVKEVEETIREAADEAIHEVDLPKFHPKLMELLGRLRYRTSYGQNVLRHSIECAHLAGMIAAELKLDVKLAKRCALLHDIGKAVDQQAEGGHVEVAAELTRRLNESDVVVNAIAAHHEDVKPTSAYAVITQVVDAISAARPGARRETLERYIKRMEKLEEVACGFDGVRSAYAIQAGREVRVIVDPQQVSDRKAMRICREISRAVEDQLVYPGEVKVTVLRETRVVEYAR
jgi:ribonuclease Y